MKRLALYVDGFNLYHAIDDLKRPHLKWVNLFDLARALARSNEEVVSVKYFSAYATWLPGPYARHRQYVAALSACGVQCIMAHFKEKSVTCRQCSCCWKSREEKETDVQLALHMLADAADNAFDRAALLTADSDMVPVVKMVKQRYSDKQVLVVAPPQRHRHGRHLSQEAHSYYQLGIDKLEGSLLPATIQNGNSIVVRPKSYDPP